MKGRRLKIVRALLMTGGLSSAGMAVFHFFLPDVFQWSRFMATVPASIVWGMYAINAFFSFLLLLGSVATIRVALAPAQDRAVVWGMAIFWGFNVVYQVIWPFPKRSVWLATLAFAVTMLALYTMSLWLLRRYPGPG
jgi:hypothetical protein